MRFFLTAVFVLLPAIASAQVANPGLAGQITPDSFKLSASAIASPLMPNYWRTMISYTLKNNSGMNLYMGVIPSGTTVGSCSDDGADVTGGIPPLWSDYPSFVPAGATIRGNISIGNCSAPNPGSPTVDISIMFGIARTRTARPNRIIELPLSTTGSIKQYTQ